MNLRVDNVILPPLAWNEETREWMEPADDWGELRFCKAAPEAGAGWTDDGVNVRDERQLKARAEGEWRRVPTSPPLTKLLRWQSGNSGPAPVGAFFYGVRGGQLASITYRRSCVLRTLARARGIAPFAQSHRDPASSRHPNGTWGEVNV